MREGGGGGAPALTAPPDPHIVALDHHLSHGGDSRRNRSDGNAIVALGNGCRPVPDATGAAGATGIASCRAAAADTTGEAEGPFPWEYQLPARAHARRRCRRIPETRLRGSENGGKLIAGTTGGLLRWHTRCRLPFVITGSIGPGGRRR